jgi:hypothetical protein
VSADLDYRRQLAKNEKLQARFAWAMQQFEAQRGFSKRPMAAWSQSLGRELKWIGFEHEDVGHPHVHVVVAGYAGGKQVGVPPKDLQALRGWAERDRSIFRREDRTIAQEVERLTRGPERERDWDRGR